MNRCLIAILTLAALVCGTSAAGEKPVTLKFSNIVTQSGIDAGKEFKRIAEEESGGSITVNVFDSNQLGDDRVVTESTIFGDIDIAVSSTSPLATMFADFYIFDAPYIFMSPEEAYANLDGEIGGAILADMAEKGLKGLCWWENGFRNFTNSKRIVRVPADVAGMKVRTMENEIHLAAWKAFGANPTPMAGPEVFTALQQGAIDAQENPFGVIDGNKFYEVQKYISLTEHVYTPFVVFMNMDRYASLSDRQRAAIDKAAKLSTEYQRRRNHELNKVIADKCVASGVTITPITAAEKKEWRDLVIDAGIYDLAKKKMDHPAYMDAILER